MCVAKTSQNKCVHTLRQACRNLQHPPLILNVKHYYFDHSNTDLARYSDPHCSLIFSFCVQNSRLNFKFFKFFLLETIRRLSLILSSQDLKELEQKVDSSKLKNFVDNLCSVHLTPELLSHLVKFKKNYLLCILTR